MADQPAQASQNMGKPDDKFELQFKVMDYHHRAMETRRTIQVQIFLGTVAVYWLLTLGAKTLISEWKDSQVFIRGAFISIAFLYLLFTIQVEGWNKHDRQKYLSLERNCGLLQ